MYADFDELERVAELCPECILMPDPGHEENLTQVINRFQPSVIAAVWRHFFVDSQLTMSLRSVYNESTYGFRRQGKLVIVYRTST